MQDNNINELASTFTRKYNYHSIVSHLMGRIDSLVVRYKIME